MKEDIEKIRGFDISSRIKKLKEDMFAEPRFMSIEQAKIITESYKENEDKPKIIKRARAIAHSLEKMSLRIDPGELIVGNRTPGVRAGVVFPEGGIDWINEELDTLPNRPQDKFEVREEDKKEFRENIFPYWEEKSLENRIENEIGDEIEEIKKVVKINQTDHAQGHVCPNVEKWLSLGPAGIKSEAKKNLQKAKDEKQKKFYEAEIIILEAAQSFIEKYGKLAKEISAENEEYKKDLEEISRICNKLADSPPKTFHEALQSVWFLFVILEMESNASSFSPGRLDQYLYPYFMQDMEQNELTLREALELIEAIWLKFNQIVYLRNEESAKYFAGFPIGFNVAIGGQTTMGEDASNLLSYLCLKAQGHLGLPQPNFSARLHENSPHSLVRECSRVIGKGSGMPQIFNDKSIIPALKNQGVTHEDAMDYSIVGCVEISSQGNYYGWSDAAMFNMVKALELAINNGKSLLTGKQIGPDTGSLKNFSNYEELEKAFKAQIDYFMEKMIKLQKQVDSIQGELLPSPFLSSVIDNCMEEGQDVTRGGAEYNFSGIQAIQVANISDSLAALRKLVFEDNRISGEKLLEVLQKNYDGEESLRQFCLKQIPKYGNDVPWVDKIANKWMTYFTEKLKPYTNARGGPFHTGLYTVSAHVPMGQNVGATPDGRLAEKPLADGGMSAVYGRDKNGPTALLKSVSRVDSMLGSNGTLLNMKFSPRLFDTEEGIEKFSYLLKTFVRLKINHVQFNVVRKEDLLDAKENPENYQNLTVRVAGYTAYFTELAKKLQDEIITRTSYGGV